MENKWKVKFHTHSRHDVMQVCKLLAKAVGVEAISDKRLNINVTGSVKCGKSAICDGITAAFSDLHNCHLLPVSPLIENVSGEAMIRKSSKTYPVKGESCDFTLIHLINEMDLDNGYHSEARKRKSDRGGVDFMTMCGHQAYRKGDVSISFNHNLRCSYGNWPRKWEIVVRDPGLQTPEMMEVIDHLRSFHERRQSRVTELGHNDVSLW